VATASPSTSFWRALSERSRRFTTCTWRQANQNNASGDKHIVYSSAGQTVTPETTARRVRARVQQRSAHADREGHAPSIIDNALVELNQLKAKLGTVEQVRLDAHVEALREVEARLQDDTTMTCEPNQVICFADRRHLRLLSRAPAVVRGSMVAHVKPGIQVHVRTGSSHLRVNEA